MTDLIKEMQEDANAIPENNMGKIGAVANDVADTDQEIQDLEDKLKVKKDYKKHLSENVLPNLFAEVGLSELKLADGRHLKVGNYYGASIKDAKKEASAIIEQANKRASQIIDEAKDQAKTEAERVKAGAKAEIDMEVNRAKEELRSKVAILALAGAEKILQANIDEKTNAALVNDLASQL